MKVLGGFRSCPVRPVRKKLPMRWPTAAERRTDLRLDLEVWSKNSKISPRQCYNYNTCSYNYNMFATFFAAFSLHVWYMLMIRKGSRDQSHQAHQVSVNFYLPTPGCASDVLDSWRPGTLEAETSTGSLGLPSRNWISRFPINICKHEIISKQYYTLGIRQEFWPYL